MAKKISRRDFIKGGIIIAGGSMFAVLTYLLKRPSLQNLSTQLINTDTFTPMDKVSSPTVILDPTPPLNPNLKPRSTPTPTLTQTQQSQPSPSSTSPAGEVSAKFPGRVVHVHHDGAHDWNYRDLNYWGFVNQGVVDDMVDQGVMSLTDRNDVVDAWRALIPSYQSGQIVAIKVSFNNSHDAVGSIEEIDGIIEPINAIIRGLNAINIPNSSIVVYDSSRWLPNRFIEGCDYPGVLFKSTNHDPWGEGSSMVDFNPPDRRSFTQHLSKEVSKAEYLINVPVLKAHGMTQISLGMKNHYGSIEKPLDLHQWSSLGSPNFSTSYNPIVDLNTTPHIRDKTILTIGDAIFAAFKNHDVRSFPQGWLTFGNQTPKSLFFGTDPVAIDCVMADTLNIEKIHLGKGEINPDGYAYLSLAEKAGLGVFERGNPQQNNYKKIEFIKREL